MSKCKGCGVTLQYIDKKKIGYSPKEDSEYCQRCFRIKHYDDLTVSMKEGINPDEVFKKIDETTGLIVWVVDIFDFEASIIQGINRHLYNRDIIMVATKRDLLPKEISDHKLSLFIRERLNEYGIKIKGLLITSKNEKKNRLEIIKLLKEYSINNEVVVIGKANAGKSTFLNMLGDSEILTKSLYPGTTLDFNEFEIEGFKFIDTPGIEVSKSMLMELAENDLKLVVPSRTIKPTIFQVSEEQSFAIGGLIRLDLINVEHCSVVFYVGDKLKIHRGKLSNADNLWENHKGSLLTPIVEGETACFSTKKYYDKMDVVIDGLGFIKISGEVGKLEIYHPKNVNVSVRKAML